MLATAKFYRKKNEIKKDTYLNIRKRGKRAWNNWYSGQMKITLNLPIKLKWIVEQGLREREPKIFINNSTYRA